MTVGREALGAYVGGLWPLLGPMLAVLGRSRGYVDGLGMKNMKNMATLKMCLFLEQERDLQSGGRS